LIALLLTFANLAAADVCTDFSWIGATVGGTAPMLIYFTPTISGSIDDRTFTGFRMTLPAKYNLPVSTPTELVTKSDGSIG